METTYNKVYQALWPIYEWSKTLDFKERNEYSNPPFGRTINLRFDMESLAHGRTNEQSLYLAFVQVRDDLMDLVTNGDIQVPEDALLKSFDGEVKRGQPLSKIHIPRASMFREYRPIHSSYEYTLYMSVYTEFGVDS